MMIWLFGNVDFFPASLVWLLIVILKMQYGPSGESLQALTPGKVSHLALDWKPSRRSCTRLRNESDRNGSLGWLSGVILLFSIVQIFMSTAISYFYRTQNSVSHVWNLFQIVGFVKIDTRHWQLIRSKLGFYFSCGITLDIDVFFLWWTSYWSIEE